MTDEKEIINSKKAFDLHEAVILLEVFLFGKRSRLKNTEMAKIASECLRNLATQRGMDISDSFRSPMGLQNRLRSIGCIFEGTESKSAPGTKVFREAVELYKNDRQGYRQILNDVGIPKLRSSKKELKSAKSKIVRTKFVRTQKDQRLKNKYPSEVKEVYYALKAMSEKHPAGVTGTDVFLALDRLIKRKDILEILDNASWSRKASGNRYRFFDKQGEERKKRKMEEAMKSAEKEFFAWLPSDVPPRSLEEVRNSYQVISSMLVQKKVLPQPLIAIKQIGQVENALKQVKGVFGSKRLRNRATVLLTAYLAYLREIKNTQHEKAEIQGIEIQEDWIRFDFTNAQSFERTSPAYCNVGGTVLEGRSWARILVAIVELEIANGSPAMQSLYKKPLYANRAERPFLMKERIDGLNCAVLSNGFWINVNWGIPRLMEIIQAFCLHCGYSKKQVMLYGVPKGSGSGKRVNSAEKKAVDRSFNMEKAEDRLREAGLHGLTVQELIDAVQPNAAVSSTRNALDGNRNVVAMPENRYVLADCFFDLDEAEDGFARILKTHFAQFGGYSNNQLLFRAASQELFMFLNDNDCENIDAVYAIARYLFEKKADAGQAYKFSPPHIFEREPDYPMTLRGLMINLARNCGGVLDAAEAKNYLQKTMLVYGSLGQLLQIGSSNTFLLYDSNRYILSEALGIDDIWCRRMHDKMDDLFRKANVAYVIPRDISSAWLDTLPPLPLDLPWTHLFLQEVLNKYPAIGFKSISPDLNQTHDTLSAAFVPLESPLQSFPDVVTLFMEERHELPMRIPGEELRMELRDAGMLEAGEMIYALPKALDDYRFAWTDENKTVLIRGNK